MIELNEEKSSMFNNIILNCGLFYEDDDTGHIYLITDDSSEQLIFNNIPVISDEIYGFGEVFKPLYNIKLIKYIFNLIIANIKASNGNNAVVKGNKEVISYGFIKQKDSKKSSVSIYIADGSSFDSSFYYNDALKFMECIEYIVTGKYPLRDKYQYLDFTDEEMNTTKSKRK